MEPATPEVTTPQPEIPQIPEVKKSSHGMTILATALFILASLAIIIFLYYQNQQLKSMLLNYQSTPTPVPTASTDPTADWKTYSNTVLGFTIKMPLDADLVDKADNNYLFRGAEYVYVLGITNQLMKYNSLPTCPLQNVKIIPCVLSTFDGTKEIRKKTIDGKKAISFQYWYMVGEKHTIYQTIEEPFVQLEFNGQVYNENIGIEGTRQRDQILSTFKFLEESTPASSPSPF